MKIQICKPNKKTREFQNLFNQTDKETINCLFDEINELYSKLEQYNNMEKTNVVYIEKKFAYRNKNNGKWLKFIIAYDVIEDVYECEDVIDCSLFRARNIIEETFLRVRIFKDDDGNVFAKREDYELIEVKVNYEI